MWIKGVTLDYTPKNMNEFKFEVGEKYEKGPYYFCDNPYTILGYFEVTNVRFLKITPLEDPVDYLGNGEGSYVCNKIMIDEEIPLEEIFLLDRRVKDQYDYFKNSR